MCDANKVNGKQKIKNERKARTSVGILDSSFDHDSASLTKVPAISILNVLKQVCCKYERKIF